MRTKLLMLLILALVMVSKTKAETKVELIAVCRIPGTTRDLSRDSKSLETGTPSNSLGGLSAIDYTQVGNRYVVLADRGPGDGAASYPCRFHTFDLDVDSKNNTLRAKLISTQYLFNKDGASLNGGLAGLRSWNGVDTCPSLDPEGLRCLPQDQMVISDEYGPFIHVFDRVGKFVRTIPLPEKFALSESRHPPAERGAFSNRGLEGIAWSKDTKRFVAAMQGPLVQDGRIENGKCLGLNTRWLSVAWDGSEICEWVYPLDDESTGVSEVLAVDRDRFLVIERDGRIGLEAKWKRIYLANISEATDVQKIDSLHGDLPDGVKPISKELFMDLLDPRFELGGESAPEKPEGITWGPSLDDGRKLLIDCFDNDCNPANESIFAAFAVSGL